MCLIPTWVLGNGTVGHRDFVQRNGEHHVAVFIESDAFVTCFTLIFPLKSVTGSLFSVPLHKGTVRSQDIANHLFTICISPAADIIQTVLLESQFQTALQANGTLQCLSTCRNVIQLGTSEHLIESITGRSGITQFIASLSIH